MSEIEIIVKKFTKDTGLSVSPSLSLYNQQFVENYLYPTIQSLQSQCDEKDRVIGEFKEALKQIHDYGPNGTGEDAKEMFYIANKLLHPQDKKGE